MVWLGARSAKPTTLQLRKPLAGMSSDRMKRLKYVGFA